MKSIAVTKPDMGVLSRDRLILSPFGTLSQAFGEELLARAQQQEGVWPYVPLELLEEGEEPQPPAAPVKPVLQVNLQLVLEALRREGQRTEQQQATQRIVERILQLQTRPAAQKKETPPAPTPAQPLQVFGTVRQEFHQNLNQTIRISAPSPTLQPTLGGLARSAERFSQHLQVLREEGAAPAQESQMAQGKVVLVPAKELPSRDLVPAGSTAFHPLPQEALTLLEQQGDETAHTAASARSAQLLRRADALATRLEETLEAGAKGVFAPPSSAGKHKAPDVPAPPRPTTQWGEAPEHRPNTGTANKAAPSRAPMAQGGQTPSLVHEVLPTAPVETLSPPSAPGGLFPIKSEPPATARDIRVSPDTPLGRTAAQERGEQTAEYHRTAPIIPGLVSGAASEMVFGQAVPGQAVLPPTPLDLTLRTEEEKSSAGEQVVPKPSPAVETWRQKAGETQPAASAPPQDPASPFHTQSRIPQAAPSYTSARDIRVSLDTPLGSTAAQEMPEQTMGHSSASPMAPGQVSGTAPQTASGQAAPGVFSPTPLDLTLRTEEENAASAGQVFPKPSSPVEKSERKTGKTQQGAVLPAQDEASPSYIQPWASQAAPHTAARDIRFTSSTPLGGIAAQEASAQATGHRIAVSMTAAPEQDKGAIFQSVPGQGDLSTPLDLVLPTEGAQAQAGEIIPNLSHPVETSGGEAAGQLGAAHTAHGFKPRTPGRPSPWLPHTAARDIRARSLPDHSAASLRNQASGTVLPTELTLNQPAPTGTSPTVFSAAQVETGVPIAEAAAGRSTSLAEPLSLTYGPAQGNPSPPPPEPQPGGEPLQEEESEFVRSLPDWARRFLKQSRSTSAPHTMGVARDIATVPPPQQAENVQWTSPNYHPPQATITHREKKQEEGPKAAQEVHISEAEIQRTADRVYRIIEDRIRRERRRLGL